MPESEIKKGKGGKKRIGEHKLTKIVPVKVDGATFYRLRSAQLDVKELIANKERSADDMEELASSLRERLYEYIQKLEEFVNDGKSMKKKGVEIEHE